MEKASKQFSVIFAVCPRCKGKFSIRCDPNMYVWKFRKVLYCSYSCMRNEEKEYYKNNKNINYIL